MTIIRIDRQPTEEELIKSIADDPVERNEIITKMLRIFGDIEGPFSIFIDSAWGDGKTFLVKQVEMILRLLNPNMDDGVSDETLETWKGIEGNFLCEDLFFPVYFNAWENDDFNDPLLPLLATMAANCDYIETKMGANARKAIAGVMDVLAGVGAFAAGATGFLPGGTALSLGAAKLDESLERKDLLEAYAERLALRKRFDLIAEASLVEVANKVVLFIDELDRCRPSFAVKLLEQAKALFNQGNVIVVYSTESTQLSHAIRGLYGEGFDAGKYLERFYDMKVDLPPVNSARYLKYLGFEYDDQYNYTIVANGFIQRLQPTMRDANRLVENLKRGQRYFKNRERDPFHGHTAVYVAEGVVLPTLIVMEYDAPELWQDVLRGRDFSCVYRYGKENRSFIEVFDSLLSNCDRLEKPYEASDEARTGFIEMVCANIFLDDYNDPRFRKASETIEGKMLGHVNKQLFRTLAEGY